MYFDGLCNYLYSFQKLGAASVFININWNFPDQGKVGRHTSIFTETNVHFMRFFAQRHLLLQSSWFLRIKKLRFSCNFNFIFLRVYHFVIIFYLRSFLYKVVH